LSLCEACPLVNASALPGHRPKRYLGGMDNRQKVIVLHGFSPEEAVAAMRALKSALPQAADAAYAMSTDTNMDWKLKDLIEHVSKEHRLYKETAKPKQN
jgi:hypothetical protein